MQNPYDELPYESYPIEWTAPEWLALVSMLHGGPRTRVARARVLELGCGDGANLLPMAAYRPSSAFVGLDSSTRLLATAREDQLAANLSLLLGESALG